jgi:hypothetical protein
MRLDHKRLRGTERTRCCTPYNAKGNLKLLPVREPGVSAIAYREPPANPEFNFSAIGGGAFLLPRKGVNAIPPARKAVRKITWCLAVGLRELVPAGR